VNGRFFAALVLAVALASPAHAQGEVALDNAWMRPAHAGQAQAAVYLDIRAAKPMTLVGASSPAARRAELVLVDPPDPDPATHRFVAELPMSATRLRLALGGSHVRLIDIAHDLRPGERVRLELAFVDASGTRSTATTEVLVRGLMIHPPQPQAPDKPAPDKPAPG
jgi:copper(I)-binding protein